MAAPQQFSNYAAQPVALQRFSSVPMTSLVQQQQQQQQQQLLQCTCGQPHDALEMNELTAQCQYQRAAAGATFDNGVLMQQSPSRQMTSNGGRYVPPNAGAYLMARPQQSLVERTPDANEFRRVAPGLMDASELAAGSRHSAARRSRAQRAGPYEALYNEQQLQQQQLGMRQPLYMPANPADFRAQQAVADFTGGTKSHSSNNIASHQQTWALVQMDDPLAQQQLMQQQQQQQQARQAQQQAQFAYYTAGRMSRRSGPVGLGETVSDMGGGGRFDPLGQQLIPIELRHSGRLLNQQPQALTANMAALRSNRAGALSPQPQRLHNAVPQHFYEQQSARALYLSQTPQAQAQAHQQLLAQDPRAFVTHQAADAMRSANESSTRVSSSQQQQQAAVGRIESSQSRTSTPAAAYEITV